MFRKTGKFFLALTAILLSALPAALAAPPGFEQAVVAFNNHQYAEALAQFKTINNAAPNDAKTHYYLGLCYQYTTQMMAAQQEYSWVYSNSTDQALRYNAWQALSQLQRWSAHRNYSGQGNDFQRVSTNKPVRARPSTDPPVTGST